jgi:VWFA-related protein
MRPLALFLLLFPAAAQAQVQETITVARIILDVRVTDRNSNLVRDLAIGDFVVEVDGRPAEIEALEWIEDTSTVVVPESEDEEVAINTPEGRLLVVFVQTDFARNRVRMEGQLKFNDYAERFLEMLEEQDRVAVVSFDSKLKFRLDFTNRKSDVARVIREAILTNQPQRPPVVPHPSLAARLTPEEMQKATTSEKALTVVANALRPIRGPKSLILLGWGLGELASGYVRMRPEWKITQRALDAARVSIFSLDTTAADAHSLAVGLATASHATGGTYSSTFRFPQLAIDRLERVLQGHYELTIKRPVETKTRRIAVKVKRKGDLSVHAPLTF